ncbi:DUF1835 domain-containing protein [Halalkalibacter krulwichiae]|uniref:DUF1835 domain-containing protein n=1 Tax=Halalkalibacter krulwichiae TaxID=199441 RepID=A0A1X9MDI1_9BACI|nr:DUF1835 domain-containing protein [Halalkalibacter krulwichiae]ARK29611.1 hypothetical protein BkAM31D_06910 [Halalkalibacter krulwichiae]
MINELKKKIEHLHEEEAKELLFHLLLKMNMLESTSSFQEVQLTELKTFYQDLLEKQGSSIVESQYQKAHIVFGDSASGCLKSVLEQLGKEKEEVITFSDQFSIGPLWNLEEEVGKVNRYEWLKDHINYHEKYIDSYLKRFDKTIEKVKRIPNNNPILIWYGDNAHEQTGLRFVLYLLKGRQNEVVVLNTSKLYPVDSNIAYRPLYTGEISPEKVQMIYEHSNRLRFLEKMERQQFEEEWEELATAHDVLRIWKGNEVLSVSEDFYDDYIVQKARNLHYEQVNKSFIKAARVIGEVIGHVNQYIGDEYIEYRLRSLIMNGVFEIKGVPKALRYYSVKIR